MSNDDVKKRFEAERTKTEQFMKTFFEENLSKEEHLHQAMSYSLFNPGKRMRPILFFETVHLLLNDAETHLFSKKFLPVACGIEMIHTYSLIHDDLPAMDNDDFRRGKPTNHKVFGEAMAILAGDGLLTNAFDMICHSELPAKYLIKIVQNVAQAAGMNGMVLGQAIDIEAQASTVPDLQRMHSLKTGALFQTCIQCGIFAAESEQIISEETKKKLTAFGKNFGLAFQIANDLVDIQQDLKQHKKTYATLLTEEKAIANLEETIAAGLKNLETFDEKADGLRALLHRLQMSQRS